MICKLSAFFAILFSSSSLFSQLTMPPPGGNNTASVSERIGITDVIINYNRPGVKRREGKIWNGLVHFGSKDVGFGTSKAAPCRAGANENTTITLSTDAKVRVKKLRLALMGFSQQWEMAMPH